MIATLHDRDGSCAATRLPATPEQRAAFVQTVVDARNAALTDRVDDDLRADIEQRALDRIHGRETAECGHHRGDGRICTRPARHPFRHATACGTQRWES